MRNALTTFVFSFLFTSQVFLNWNVSDLRKTLLSRPAGACCPCPCCRCPGCDCGPRRPHVTEKAEPARE